MPANSFAKSKVLAIVNDIEITEDDLIYELEIEHRREGDRAPEFDIRRFLERVIDDTLVLEEALQMGLDTGPWVKERVDEYILAESVKRLYNEEVIDRIRITEKELKDYFRKNYETFELMIIETTTEEKIKEAEKELLQGVRFEDVMERYSDVKRKKDDYTVKYYYKTLIQSSDFFNILLKLKPGELSKPFKTGDRYYIIKLITHTIPDDKELEKRKETILREFKKQKEDELARAYLERLRKKFNIWRNEGLIGSLKDRDSLKDLKDDRRIIARVDKEELSLGHIINPEKDIKGSELDRMIEGWIDRKVVDREALGRKYYEKSPLKERVLRYRNQLVRRVFIGSILLPKINADEKALRDYYENNIERYRLPDQFRLQKIVLKTLEEAQSVHEKLKKGADFGWLARQVSVDESSKAAGYLSWQELFSFSDKERKEIGKLAPGEISNIIEDNGRYTIFRLVEKKQGILKDFDSIRESVKNDFITSEMRKLLREYINSLRKDARIVYKEENIKDLEERFKKKN